ncbi:LuxR C-terminal-related transcriptional regulator [Paenibacillus silvae]|uniref:HTH luxR-type domain-containing protein n=1 Tax=Paenibacillus silvae TaxID=1325358 RepID=A0A2W6NNK9_9BACL|nr:LuxR C-terminal-related transcriptional regulator [Paenibacillus silvae]PZT57437.1 hypothetical protein DN757_01930 [Paenibacillus silvae]
MKERKLSNQQEYLLGMVEKFKQHGLSYDDLLTERERLILTLFLEGGTNVSIAEEVGLTKQRVSHILVNKSPSIYSKLRGRWQSYSYGSKSVKEVKLTKEEVLSKLESLDREVLNDALKSLNLAHLKKILREAERQYPQEPIIIHNSEDILNDLKF